MQLEAVEHILRRCISLLKRKSGTSKTKNEYYYWISWLKVQFKGVKKVPDNILKIVNSNRDLQIDFGKLVKLK